MVVRPWPAAPATRRSQGVGPVSTGSEGRGPAQFSGATSWKVVEILPPQSGLVVVAPDGH